MNLAAEEWVDDSPKESHEYEFDEWHEWHEDDAYALDAWENEQPDAEEHESVPEDLESGPSAWVSRDGSGHKGKSRGKGGGKRRSYGKKATATRWRRNWKVEHWSKQSSRSLPLPRLHRTLQRTELLLNTALVSNVQDSEHRMR